jgi:hypothetical protein
VRHEQVYFLNGVSLVLRSGWSASQSIPPTGLQAGHHGVRAAEQHCCEYRLPPRRIARKQQDDAGQRVLPWPAVEAAPVNGSLAHSGRNELLRRRDAGGEHGTER